MIDDTFRQGEDIAGESGCIQEARFMPSVSSGA
jgi:hypothetical protein